MKAEKEANVMPAFSTIKAQEARDLIDMMLAEGKRLMALLEKVGIVRCSSDRKIRDLNLDMLKKYFRYHAVVIEGDLPRKYWPRVRGDTGADTTRRLCTCLWFVQHGECEHK
eukprot:7642826-Karenia_brevis.AAC.1